MNNNTSTEFGDPYFNIIFNKGEFVMSANDDYKGPERRQEVLKLNDVLKMFTEQCNQKNDLVAKEVQELGKQVAVVSNQVKAVSDTTHDLVLKLFDQDVGMFRKMAEDVKELNKDINGNGKPGLKKDVETLCADIKLVAQAQKSSEKYAWKTAIIVGGIFSTVIVVLIFILGNADIFLRHNINDTIASSSYQEIQTKIKK